MSGVFLGMSAGALVATGISIVGGTVSAISSSSKANEAARRGESARNSRNSMLQGARDKISASNAYKELSINQKAYNDQLDSLIAAQSGQQLGGADQRQVSVGAARQQAVLNKGLSDATQSQIDQETALDDKIAGQDVKIKQQLASMDLGEANAYADEAKAMDAQAAAYQQQANKAIQGVVTDVVTPLAQYGGAKLDSKIAGNQLMKSVGTGEKDVAGMISGLGLDKFDGTTYSGDNTALASILGTNSDLSSQLGLETTDQGVFDALMKNLSTDQINLITGGQPDI